MFTWGPKYLFGISLSALVAAVVYGLVTGGELVGVLTSGYKGGVGEHAGYAILLGVFLSFQVLCWILVAVRDGDAETLATRVGAEALPVVAPPADASPWGMMVAFGLAFVVLGVVAKGFLYIGVAIVIVGALQWLLLAWSDRATGDPATNRIIRRRIAGPFEVPVLSALGIAVVVFCASRVFLAVPSEASVAAGAVATVLVFGGAVVLSSFDLKPALARGALILGAIILLAAGITSGIFGERDFHHGEAHATEGGAHDVEGEGE